MAGKNDDFEILNLEDLIDDDEELKAKVREAEHAPRAAEETDDEDENEAGSGDGTGSGNGKENAAKPDAGDGKTSASAEHEGHPAAPASKQRKNSAVPGKRSGKTEHAPDGEKGRKAGKSRINLNAVLLIVIAAVALTAVVRFLIWNRGVDIHFDPLKTTTKYDVEVNDNMVYLPKSKLEGHEDDGKTTILCLGNSPFSDDVTENGLAGQIAKYGNATVINAAFPQSQVTCKNAKYSTESLSDMDDIFNLFYVSYYISLGDYSALETVAKNAHPDNDQYMKSVKALEQTDMNSVDIIAVMYDAVDYENGSPVINEGYDEEMTTYVGSLKDSFKLLQEKYPWIRIVFLSPTYMEHEENGETQNGRQTDLGKGTLIQYWQFAYDTCGDMSVSFLDNYYGSINEHNYKDYLKDNIHINTDGFQKIADHFIYTVLQENYSEYDVSSMMVIH